MHPFSPTGPIDVCACVYVEGTQLEEEVRGRVSLRKSGEEAGQEGQQDPEERHWQGQLAQALSLASS